MIVRIALVLAVIALAGTGAGLITAKASTNSSFLIVGIDVDVADNTPRSLVDFDDCGSVEAGDTIDIDIAVPEPGIPADRGLSGYQFRLFYDPQIMRVTVDSGAMLLDQAPGSNIIPLADPKPDSDGVYLSSGVDFGEAGTEPDGTSESGPGVLGRITLEARSAGMTGLVLQDVVLKDDASQDIAVDSVQSARIYVGEPCPGFEPSPTRGPTATPSPAPMDVEAGGTPTATDPAAGGVNGASPASGPVEMVTSGGPPPGPSSGHGTWVALAGAVLAVTGLTVAFGGLARLEREWRGDASK